MLEVGLGSRLSMRNGIDCWDGCFGCKIACEGRTRHSASRIVLHPYALLCFDLLESGDSKVMPRGGIVIFVNDFDAGFDEGRSELRVRPLRRPLRL